MPADLTPLIGRRRETTLVRRRLSLSRLVTLTGVGGVGKTRLALDTAAKVGHMFPDGVHVVELATVREGELVLWNIAACLRLPDRPGHAALDMVVDHLRDKRLLLVLDNCEHLVDACVATVDTLLRAAPAVRILVTSRQVLGITGEQTFSVPPLPTPVPGRRTSASDLLRYPAVVLFEQRAAAIAPGFQVGRENAEAVTRLVHALEGIPLAIELAAAWMRTLTVQEILSRLEDRFSLLRLGSRAALPRQRTLRGLVDWSYELCTEQEQALWARASVFSGDFDLCAAEAVCAGEGLAADTLVEVVNGLVEKSVLSRSEHSGRARYRMLETLREYGQERLSGAGALTRFRRRHRDHYLGLTARAEAQWFGPEQEAWFARLRGDHPNLRVALEFCLQTPGEATAGLALAVAPRHYWISCGSLGEGRDWLSRLLEADRANGAASAIRASALATHAYLGILQGTAEDILGILDEAQTLAARMGDRSTLAWVCHHRAVAATWNGDIAQAAALFEQAATALRELGDIGGTTECTTKLALALAFVGDLPRAAALCDECEAVISKHGESWLRGFNLFTRALLCWHRDEFSTAGTLARNAVGLLRPFNDWWDIAMCVDLAAWSAAQTGMPERAAGLFGVVRSLWASIGASLHTAPFMAEAHERYERDVRGELGTKAFQRALRGTANLSLVNALDYVVDDQVAGTSSTRRSAERHGRSIPQALTRREREVAELAALGMSNREIATKLVIAQRTAEGHIERVLAKLGFRSRAQLAGWVHQQRSAPERLPSNSTPRRGHG